MVNPYGLPRAIPPEKKLLVRQECENGCVICGRFPYDYDHFDPEYVDAKAHDTARIALLCKPHHDEKTAGRLPTAEVARARLDPFNRTNEAWWKITLGTNLDWRFVAGGFDVSKRVTATRPIGITINGVPIISLRTDERGTWLLSASFVDDQGRACLRIEDNEGVISRGVWDVTLKGPELLVRRGKGDVVARLLIDGKAQCITLDKLSMGLANGHRLEVSRSKGLKIAGATLQNNHTDGTAPILVMLPAGSTRRDPATGRRIVPPVKPSDSTIAVNRPDLGTWNDWVAKDGH